MGRTAGIWPYVCLAPALAVFFIMNGDAIETNGGHRDDLPASGGPQHLPEACDG